MKRFLALLGVSGFGCVHAYDYEAADVVYIIPDICTESVEEFVCPQGDYSADTAFKVIYQVGVLDEEFDSGMCSIEQIGEFELRIHISYRVVSGPSEQGVGKSYHDCDDMTPPLAAGTWTIHHASGSTTLEIPSKQADTACLFPYEEGNLSCAETVWGE